MRAIKSKNTLAELIVRKALHAAGFRYRLHSPKLPRKPDLVLPKYRAVIFVQGCFWHQHDCSMFKMPKEREEFWRQKLGGNVHRDNAKHTKLLVQEWRIAMVWECSLKGRNRLKIEAVVSTLSDWLKSDIETLVIRERLD